MSIFYNYIFVMERRNINLLFILVNLNIIQVNSFMVTLSDTAPVVMGANVTFKAELFDYSGEAPHGKFNFYWKDNAIPQHTFKNDVYFDGKNVISIWNVSYPAEVYAPGPYEVDVTVYEISIFYRKIASNRKSFNVTGMLNGKIISEQTDNEEADTVVSNTKKVVHNISLQPADYAYITQPSYKILTFWFIDCVYYGYTNGFTFSHNYTQENVAHDLQALVVASYEPMVTTTVPPTTTTPVPHNSTNASSFEVIQTTTETSTVVPKNLTAPFVCLNKTIIATDPNNTYGYFQKHIKVEAPVHNVSITGNNWLQHGDIVYINVKCDGSSNFTHCYYIYSGVINVTGNERCAQGHIMSDCNFTITHYFKEPGSYTIIIIINNDVSKVIKPIAINIYEVAKQPQLSVIVVPVTCSVIAVIIIVFGVAYYVQSKMRYTIEVADFDFGQVESMEYKTFKERLWQDVMNAFNRSSDYVEASTSSNAWSPHNKYSNMQ